MPQLRCIVEQHPFLVHLYFKYESDGKCCRKFLSSGDECFKSSRTNGHKIVKLWSCKATVVHALKEHDLVARVHFVISFFSLGTEKLTEWPVLRCRKSRIYSLIPSSWQKKMVFGVHTMRCNNYQAKTSESKEWALLVYWLHYLRRATFSVSDVALVGFY